MIRPIQVDVSGSPTTYGLRHFALYRCGRTDGRLAALTHVSAKS